MRAIDTVTSKGVMTITLSDEANKNVLSAELTDGLVQALEDAENNDAVRVVVLTNAGNVFCAGADLRKRLDATPVARRVTTSELFQRLNTFPKPTVGRIAGHCMAGGIGIAAALDISVAADDTRFGFTEVRLGVSPAMISVICLPKMNYADARSAFLRGNRFPATEAARMGLINHSVTRDKLDEYVNAILQDLLAGGPQALKATKEVLRRVPAMDVQSAVAWTSEFSNSLFKSDEAREGMAAFLQKRPASWCADIESQSN